MDTNYKGLVAFDLDNTLLDHNTWRIPDSALAAVRILKRNGYLVVIASGRDMKDRNSIAYLDMIQPGALIHMNGTRIEIGDEVLRDHQMDKQILERMLNFSEEHGYAVGIAVDEKDYFTFPDKVRDHDMRFWGKCDRDFKDPKLLMKLPVRALCYAGPKDGAEALQYEFPELNVLMFSQETGADIFEKGYSKADGIAVLCERFGIPESETWALGDSYNDMEMIVKVSHGIAMGNAVPELKAVADYVTDPVGEDGIYNAMKHFGLLEA